jgi:hypothetical protein
VNDRAEKKPTKEQDALRVRMQPYGSYIQTDSFNPPQLSAKEAREYYAPPPELRGRLILA